MVFIIHTFTSVNLDTFVWCLSSIPLHRSTSTPSCGVYHPCLYIGQPRCLRVASIVMANLRLKPVDYPAPNWGGVLPIFAFWVQCLFYFETKLGGSHAQIPNVNVFKSICASRSNRVLVTKRRRVSLSATISLVRFRYERRINSCLSTLECSDRLAHVKCM